MLGHPNELVGSAEHDEVEDGHHDVETDPWQDASSSAGTLGLRGICPESAARVPEHLPRLRRDELLRPLGVAALDEAVHGVEGHDLDNVAEEIGRRGEEATIRPPSLDRWTGFHVDRVEDRFVAGDSSAPHPHKGSEGFTCEHTHVTTSPSLLSRSRSPPSRTGRRGAMPTLLLLLACAHRAPTSGPRLTPVPFAVGTISLFPGEASVGDMGAEGTISVTRPGTGLLQELNWMEEQPSEPLAERAWRIARDLVERGGTPGVPEAPTLEHGTVAGQPSTGWVMPLHGTTIHATVWTCPAANASVWLVTEGPVDWARRNHEASLATATCADVPAPHATTRTWEWTEHHDWAPGESGDRGLERRERVDGGAVSVAVPAGVVAAYNAVAVCEAGAQEAFRALSEEFGLSDAPSAERASPGVCSRHATGIYEGEPVRIVYTMYACDATYGFLAYCFLYDPEAPLDACDAALSCRAE